MSELEPLVLAALLRPGDTFVDVGANTGLYSRHALSVPGVHILAFEPLPDVARQLQADLGADHPVFATAVGRDEGTTVIYVPLHAGREVTTRASLSQAANGDLELAEHVVTVASLDRMVLHADVLKIDVEGRELDVLRSAERLLRDQPIVIVEVEQRHNGREAAEEVFDLLGRAGLHGFFIRNQPPGPQLLSLSEFDFEVHQRVENAKPIGRHVEGEYVNNFVFAPPAREDELARAARQVFASLTAGPRDGEVASRRGLRAAVARVRRQRR